MDVDIHSSGFGSACGWNGRVCCVTAVWGVFEIEGEGAGVGESGV